MVAEHMHSLLAIAKQMLSEGWRSADTELPKRGVRVLLLTISETVFDWASKADLPSLAGQKVGWYSDGEWWSNECRYKLADSGYTVIAWRELPPAFA